MFLHPIHNGTSILLVLNFLYLSQNKYKQHPSRTSMQLKTSSFGRLMRVFAQSSQHTFFYLSRHKTKPKSLTCCGVGFGKFLYPPKSNFSYENVHTTEYHHEHSFSNTPIQQLKSVPDVAFKKQQYIFFVTAHSQGICSSLSLLTILLQTSLISLSTNGAKQILIQTSQQTIFCGTSSFRSSYGPFGQVVTLLF